jgi:hypothetical protein
VSKPIVIGPAELGKIKIMALEVFRQTAVLPEDGKEAQIYMVLEGFHSFLKSQGIEPGFRVKPVREDHGDTTPLDDL